jgi:hypothetical protein
MNKPGDFDYMKITQTNTTNGALSTFNVQFKASIPVQNGDLFNLVFPSTI